MLFVSQIYSKTKSLKIASYYILLRIVGGAGGRGRKGGGGDAREAREETRVEEG